MGVQTESFPLVTDPAGVEILVNAPGIENPGRMPVEYLPAGSPIIASVFGRTGVVVAMAGDYTADMITDTASKVMMTAAERAALASLGAAAVASVFGRTGAVVAGSGDYTAGQITNVPAGTIAATTVQAALNELDAEKAATGHTHTGLAPTGGTTGQVLAKNSGTNYDFSWQNQASAPVTTVFGRTGAVIATIGDYTADMVSETATRVWFTPAEQTKLSGVAAAATANPNAIESDQAGEIAALTEKVSPASADVLLLEDSAAGYAKKKVQVGNVAGGNNGAELVGSGFATDQRAAIQAALDALPATGGTVRLRGQFRVDSPLTIPAAASSAAGEATFALVADGWCQIKAGVAQAFHVVNWSGFGVHQKLNFEFRGLKVIGLWEEQADGAGKADSSYRGIKADYANRVVVADCWVDNVRGFSISIDKCTEGVVTGCTVTRSGKDAINVSNCVVSRVQGNTVFGCGDNMIAVHAGVLDQGTIANSNGTIQTTSGSPTVAITFTGANGAKVGDRLVITGSGVVGGLNMRGTWTIATKPTASTCTFTHDYNATATVGAGTPPGASFAFEIGSGADDNRQMISVIGNSLENGFGIKVLGGPNAIIAENNIKLVHGTGIHVGGEGQGGEGMIPYRSLAITNNVITDVIKKSYLGMSAPYDACILVDHRWFSIDRARIEGNILNNNRPKGSTTKPSDWLRGYTPPNGGPASPEYRWFSADGWVDTAFSGEPTYQTQTGIQVNCRNAGDRAAIRVARNSFSGIAPNQQVRRTVPLNTARKSLTIASTSPTKANLEAYIAAITLDLAPAYGVGLKMRSGDPTQVINVEARFRKNDGIGVDAYAETSWGSGTAFATALATSSGAANTDVTTAITALPNDAKRSMDVVPYGYTAAGTAFELIELALIVDHADNDSDFVPAGIVYDPASLGTWQRDVIAVETAAVVAGLSAGELAGRIWFEV